jgi:glycosyltransferase involved in cell wall biosynthesis
VIVHVTDCFHPRLGGIELQVGELARAQQERGETVHVITATPATGPARDYDYGYEVHRVVAALPWELPVHPRAGAHLRRLFGQLRPDVVHVHLGSVSPFGWAAVSTALRCGLPTVVTVHSMWGPASRSMYRFLDRLRRWSTAPLVATAVSAASADLVTRTRPDITVIPVPNGIATQTWRCAPDDDSRDDALVHVVAVGRLAARKQPLGLMHVLAAARRRLDDAVELRASIAGDGPALPLMRTYLRAHGMTEWVRLTGRLGRDDIRALLCTADLFVNPTVWESFGLATLEARAAGVPVIARAGNGVAEYVRHGQEGLLCESADDLVEALVNLAQDGPARRRMREHNRATEPVACTWPTVTDKFARCYGRAATLACAPKPTKLEQISG